jgi:hypothetical protein
VIASIGTIDIKLLAQIGSNKPIEMGTMTMPVDTKVEGRGTRVSVSIDEHVMRRRLKAMFRAAAKAVGAKA